MFLFNLFSTQQSEGETQPKKTIRELLEEAHKRAEKAENLKKKSAEELEAYEKQKQRASHQEEAIESITAPVGEHIRTLEKKNAELMEYLAELENKTNALQRIEQELDKLQKENQELQKENTSLKNSVSLLETGKENLLKATTKIEELKNENTNIKLNEQALSKKLNKINEDKNKLFQALPDIYFWIYKKSGMIELFVPRPGTKELPLVTEGEPHFALLLDKQTPEYFEVYTILINSQRSLWQQSWDFLSTWKSGDKIKRYSYTKEEKENSPYQKLLSILSSISKITSSERSITPSKRFFTEEEEELVSSTPSDQSKSSQGLTPSPNAPSSTPSTEHKEISPPKILFELKPESPIDKDEESSEGDLHND